MSAVIDYGRLIGYEQKCFRRNPPAAILMFILPVVLTLILSETLTDAKHLLLGNALTFGVLMACYSQIAFVVVQRRDNLFLKRLRTTPMSAGRYMSVLIGNSVLVALVVSAAVFALAFGLGHAVAPRHWAALVLVGLLGMVTFCAMGLAVASLVPNEDAAPAVVWGLALPMVFLGTFFSIKSGSTLGKVAGVFPTRHLSRALIHAQNAPTGTGFSRNDLLILGAWAVGGLLLAAWRFRWEPSH